MGSFFLYFMCLGNAPSNPFFIFNLLIPSIFFVFFFFKEKKKFLFEQFDSFCMGLYVLAVQLGKKSCGCISLLGVFMFGTSGMKTPPSTE